MASEKRRVAKRKQWFRDAGIESWVEKVDPRHLLAITKIVERDGDVCIWLDYDKCRCGMPTALTCRSREDGHGFDVWASGFKWQFMTPETFRYVLIQIIG